MKRTAVARCILAFCLTVVTLGYAGYLGWGQPDTKDVRIRWLREHADEFNIMFFGSSMSRRNVDVPLFDDILRTRGYAARSFNMGIDAADMHQTDWAIRTVLSLKPKHLKYVFIDLRPFDVEIREKYRFSAPKIRWHDLQETHSVMKTVELADVSPYTKTQAKQVHWRHFFLKYLPFGAFLAPNRKEGDEPFDPELGGYHPYDLEDREYLEPHAEFTRRVPQFLEGVDRKRHHVYSEYSLQHFNLEALHEQIKIIRDAGATPIYWTAASIHGYDFANALSTAGELPAFFRFDDAENYPTLFEPDLRVDNYHLNNEGTDIFTAILADTFLSRLRGHIELTPPESPKPTGKQAS